MTTMVEEKAVDQDIYLPQMATLVEATPMTELEKFFRIELSQPNGSYKPGQFMEVSVPLIGEAPISISSSQTRCDEGTFEMVVRKVGNVTGALHAMEAGDKIGIRGPYGTHFPVDEKMKNKDLIFVCGGIGLVPLRSAIQHVLDNRADYGNVLILSGTRRPSDRLFTSELLEWKQRDDLELLETVDAADPAWGGNVGVITTLFRHIEVSGSDTVVVVCGPPIMYRFVLVEVRKLGIPDDNVYLSLERHMKCAVGKCGHCQINGIYACQDGPVFCYTDIAGLKEAI